MFGWLRFAAACASRRNRSTNDGSRAYSGNSALSATGRSAAGRARGRPRPSRPARSRAGSRSGSRRPGRPASWWRKPYLPLDGLPGCVDRTATWASRLRSEQRSGAPAWRSAPRPGRRWPRALSDAAVLDEHRDRVLRVVGGRERDEPRVRRSRPARSPRCRSCPRPARRGSAPRCRCRSGRSRPASMNVRHRRRGGRVDRAPLVLLHADARTTLSFGLEHAVDDVRLHDHALVRDRLGDERHLAAA